MVLLLCVGFIGGVAHGLTRHYVNEKVMNKFLKLLCTQTKYLVFELTSRDGYVILFKGALAVAALCLITIQQVCTLALPLENEAYKFKYEIEFETQTKFASIESMECELNASTYVKCRQSKQHESLISSSFDTLYTWSKLSAYLAFIMFFLSVLGFLAHPYFHKYDSFNSPDT